MPRLGSEVGTPTGVTACRAVFLGGPGSLVLSACMLGVVSRCLVLFKFKSIMAFPEAADTVKVSITASTAQGGVLIADAAPGEFFLSLRLGAQGLGLRFCPAGLGLGLESWHRRDGKATGLIQGSFFSELWPVMTDTLSQEAGGQV